MRFDEQCKVIISTLSKDEAKVFIKFLWSEIARHRMDIDNAINLIHDIANKFKLEGINED